MISSQADSLQYIVVQSSNVGLVSVCIEDIEDKFPNCDLFISVQIKRLRAQLLLKFAFFVPTCQQRFNLQMPTLVPRVITGKLYRKKTFVCQNTFIFPIMPNLLIWEIKRSTFY